MLRFCFFSPGHRTLGVLRGDTRKPGGAEGQIAQLAMAFAGLGHHVEMIYGNGRGRCTSQIIANVECVDAYPTWKNPGSVARLFGVLRDSDADLIYARQPDDFLWILGLIAKLAPRSRFMYALANDRDCNPWQYYNYNRWFHNPLYAVGLRSADFVAIQHPEQEQLVKPYVRGPIVCVPNIVRAVQDEPRKYEEADIDAIWIAHIRPQKQLHIFLDVAEQLPMFQFAVVGWFGVQFDGNMRVDLERRMQALENVSFLGAQHFEDVIALLARSRILVNTSNWEGFPNTMLEAWSVGVPVVSLEIDPGKVMQRLAMGLVSRTIAGMVHDVKRLARNASLNRSMGARGFQYTRESHNLNAVRKQLELILPALSKPISRRQETGL